jgi:hypothetical protein
MLGLPEQIPVTDVYGTVHPGRPMWTYWALQEGTLKVDPAAFRTADGGSRRWCTWTAMRRCLTTSTGR